jgi:hypothetical protein
MHICIHICKYIYIYIHRDRRLQQLQNTNIGNNHFEDEVNNGNNGNTFKGTYEEPAQNRPMTASSYRYDNVEIYIIPVFV